MQALIAAEAPNGERRQKIVSSFNPGYRGFQQTYRSCTPAADIAIRRYLDEGAKIARDITARYANYPRATVKPSLIKGLVLTPPINLFL